MLKTITSMPVQITSGNKHSYFLRKASLPYGDQALAFQYLPLAVLIIDDSQTILSNNLMAQQLLGGDTTVVGLPLRQFMDVPMGCRLGEILLTRADLSSSLVEVTMTPFECINEHGIAQTRWTVMLRDISGLTHATEELTEHRFRLLQALSAADMGIWDWDSSRNQVDRTARTWEIVRGLPKGSLREAQAPSITLDCMIQAVTPEHRQLMKEALLKTFEEGLPGELEVRALASDQREVWLQIWMTAYRNACGQIQGIRGLVKDISHRKRISEENLRLKEHFHRIIELSPLPTLIIELGFISLANRAALGLWGFVQMSDIIGQAVEGLLNETDRLTLHSLHKRAIAQGVADHAAMQIQRSDGLIRDVEASASLIPGQASDALQLVLYDTTEAKTTLRLLQESQQESQRLSANLLSAREEERRYIARELHDELGQRLSVLKIRINDILKQSVAANGHYAEPFQDRLEELLDDVNDMVRALRRMASHLRPAMLDDLGLQAAIEWLAQDSAQFLNIRVLTRLFIGVDELIDPVRITIYRLIQEALTNVGKHAQAKQVQITIEWDADILIASIQDDGVGPQDHSVQAKRPKWGLIGLRERAAQLGGILKVDANPSGGYRLLMQIPHAKPPTMNETKMQLEVVS